MKIYPDTSDIKYVLKKFISKAFNVRARAIKENTFEYLCSKFGLSKNKSSMRYIKIGTSNLFPRSKKTLEHSDRRASTQQLHYGSSQHRFYVLYVDL